MTKKITKSTSSTHSKTKAVDAVKAAPKAAKAGKPATSKAAPVKTAAPKASAKSKTAVTVAPGRSFKSTAANLRKRLTLRSGLVALVLLVAVAGGLVMLQRNDSTAANDPKPADARTIEQQLRAKVEGENRVPLTGRDPATQSQGSLAAAASSPNGPGARSDTPAAGVTGDHSHHAAPSDVYADPKTTGIGSSGCYLDYGKQGEECLPAHAAGDDKKLTCAEVRKFFPKGISVTGTDRFHLDHNGDKLACGSGE